MLRAAAAGVSFVLAAASGVVTALVTAHSSRGLWVALAVLVIVGAALQVAVTMNDQRVPGRVTASGSGSVAIGGSSGEISTRVRGVRGSAVTPGGDGVTASGAGAVGVGGEATRPVSTEVTEVEGQGPP